MCNKQLTHTFLELIQKLKLSVSIFTPNFISLICKKLTLLLNLKFLKIINFQTVVKGISFLLTSLIFFN